MDVFPADSQSAMIAPLEPITGPIVRAITAIEERTHLKVKSFKSVWPKISDLIQRTYSDVTFKHILLPVWIAEYICATLASRIRFRMAGVPIMISCAATRPEPSLVLHSVCEITARSDSDSIARIISFSGSDSPAPWADEKITKGLRRLTQKSLEEVFAAVGWTASATMVAVFVTSASVGFLTADEVPGRRFGAAANPVLRFTKPKT